MTYKYVNTYILYMTIMTQKWLCRFRILLLYCLFPLSHCKHKASLLASKTTLTWEQLYRTLAKWQMTSCYLGKCLLCFIQTFLQMRSLIYYVIFICSHKIWSSEKITRLWISQHVYLVWLDMAKIAAIIESVVQASKIFSLSSKKNRTQGSYRQH